MILIDCRQCGKQLKAPDSAQGKQARCPRCKAILQIPEQAIQADDLLMPLDEAPPPVVPPTQPVAAEPWEAIPPPAAPPSAPLFSEDDLAYEVAEPMSSSEPSAPARRPCPSCGELIPRAAALCHFCGEVFDASLRKRKKKQSKSGREYSYNDSEMTTGEYLFCFICSGIACWVSLFYLVQGKPKAGKMLAISFGMIVFWNVLRFVLVSNFAPNAPHR